MATVVQKLLVGTRAVEVEEESSPGRFFLSSFLVFSSRALVNLSPPRFYSPL